MDITPGFNALLRQHRAPETQKRYSIGKSDAFLKEAYRINNHISKLHGELKDVRQAYLSTAQPRKTHIRPGQEQQRYLTDAQREEIDAGAKKMLRELNASIRAMDEAEQLRRETEEALIRKTYLGALGYLGAWAAGGAGLSVSKSLEHAAAEARARDIGLHRDGVLFYLRQKLQQCGQTQQQMMETRLTREMEKNRSVLANAGLPAIPDLPGSQSAPTSMPKSSEKKFHRQQTGDEEDNDKYDLSEDLTPEQIQMFEKGNQDMMKHYQSTLDKVKTAEKSLIEISELQNLLVGNLSTQAEHIEQLVTDSFATTENVGSGNKELKKATERASTAMWTFRATAVLCTVLIAWDLLI